MGRLKCRFQFIELGYEGTQLLLTLAISVEAFRVGLDVALEALGCALLLALYDPVLTLLLQGVHIDPLQGLEEVEGSPNDRDAVAMDLLRQDTKPLTTGISLASPLLDKKLVQLLIGVGELLGLLRPGGKTGLSAGKDQIINLTAFIFVPQGTKLLDVLLDQLVATTNIIDHPGSSADEAKAQRGHERGWTQINCYTPQRRHRSQCRGQDRGRMLQRVLQDDTQHGPRGKVLDCRLAIESRLPRGMSVVRQAFPPHVGPLLLQNIFLKQDKLYSGKPIPEGTLRFPRLPRWELRRPLALSMESICIDGVHGDEILCHHFSSSQGEFPIFLLIAGARVTPHRDPVSWVVIDEQGGNLVDLLLASSIEELAGSLKSNRFDT